MSLAPASFENAKIQLDLTYKVDKNEYKFKNELVHQQAPFTSDALQVTYKVSRHTDNKGGYIISFIVKALKQVELVYFNATFLADLQDQRMLANGFQSWSQSKELSRNDKIPPIPSSVAWYTQMNLQG